MHGASLTGMSSSFALDKSYMSNSGMSPFYRGGDESYRHQSEQYSAPASMRNSVDETLRRPILDPLKEGAEER